ncbi:MAG TPA: glutaredoxin family protein [Gaiellaceae bacterium]|nr:glutaredoxin family protein [Gaiellaceae bacterium]
MAEITLYITEPTETCTRIKHLLDAHGFEYTTVNVETDEEREALVAKTGRMQCPLVLVGDELLGGLRETVEAEKSGRLAELAAR